MSSAEVLLSTSSSNPPEHESPALLVPSFHPPETPALGSECKLQASSASLIGYPDSDDGSEGDSLGGKPPASFLERKADGSEDGLAGQPLPTPLEPKAHFQSSHPPGLPLDLQRGHNSPSAKTHTTAPPAIRTSPHVPPMNGEFLSDRHPVSEMPEVDMVRMDIDFPEDERSHSPPAEESRSPSPANSTSTVPPAEKVAGTLKQLSNSPKAGPPVSAPKRELPYRGAVKSSRAKIEGKSSAHSARKRVRKTPAVVPSSEEDEGEDPPKKRVRTFADDGTVDNPIDVDQYASMWDPAPSSHYVSYITFDLAIAYPRG